MQKYVHLNVKRMTAIKRVYDINHVTLVTDMSRLIISTLNIDFQDVAEVANGNLNANRITFGGWIILKKNIFGKLN